MNKKRIIFSSICVILLISLVGGTLAWFFVNEEVTVSYGNSIFCEAGDSLEIALVENGVASRWSSSIDYSAGEFTTVDISGDGYTLYRPSEIDENQQPLNLNPATSSLEDSMSYDYVEMEVAFRSFSKMNVYLSDESYISPVSTVNDNTNIYGAFSRDYIAGAMRVAVVDETELKMLWAPNSKYQLIQNFNGSYSFKSGERGDSVAESDYYYYGMNEEEELVLNTVSSDMYASKKFVVDGTGTTKDNTAKSPAVVSLNPESEGAFDMKIVKIRIWFEGTDREAHQALAGGNVNVKLKFVGVAKETDESKQMQINEIDFNAGTGALRGMADGMVFSTNGREWTAYNAERPNLPTLGSGDSIYIKYPETETHYETDYIKFTKE